MGRAPCCDKANVKKGPWSPEEDAKLKEYIEKHGTGGNWIALPHKVGLRRCGKSCRLRWLNYLRPNIKHGEFSDEEDRIICSLFASIGSRWSIIAAQLPGRTDNDIKNYWNTKLKKKLMAMADPSTQYHHQKRPHQATMFPSPSNHNPILQNPSIPSAYISSQIRAFSRVHYEPISPTFTTLLSSNPSGHDGSLVGPVHGSHNLLIYGGDHQASCSSSDGSCTINQMISNPKEMMGPDYLCYFNDGVDENDQKLLFSTNEVNPVDYSLEEIKEMISTNNVCNNLNFFVDEIKNEENVLDY